MFKFCDPTENTSDRNLKSVFPLTEVCGTRIQQAPHANKKVFLVPSPPKHHHTRNVPPGHAQRPTPFAALRPVGLPILQESV